MQVKLINKNKTSTKVGNTVVGVSLDDLLVLEEIGHNKYKIYSPNYRLFFNKAGRAFEISFIKNRDDFIIKKKLMSILYDKKQITFDVLEKMIQETKGDELYCYKNNDNLVIWDTINRATIDAIRALLREKKIVMVVCGAEKYKESTLGIPVASNGLNTKYEEPHWVPVILKLNETIDEIVEDFEDVESEIERIKIKED